MHIYQGIVKGLESIGVETASAATGKTSRA